MKRSKEVTILVLRYISAILLLLFSDYLYNTLKPLTFYTSYFVTSLFADVTLVSDDTFVIGAEEFLFVPACAAVLAYVLLYVLILFTRGISFQMGLKIALIGSFVILVANIFRIELLIYILLKYGKDYFQTLHLFIWKFLSSVFVALLWIFFVKRYRIKGIPVYSDLKYLLRRG